MSKSLMNVDYFSKIQAQLEVEDIINKKLQEIHIEVQDLGYGYEMIKDMKVNLILNNDYFIGKKKG